MNGKTLPRILHIEDNKDIKAFVFSILQDMADISHVDSLGKAKEKLASDQYDLVILDLTLPDGSGLDLIKDLNLMQPPVAIIVHSAHEISDTMKGVDAVLSKLHTTADDLRDLVQKLTT
jgi:DNA-binding response OmpR family regulator